MNYKDKPIIVFGCARSGTTLTMQLLRSCGMQVGTTAEKHPLLEGRIREEFEKPMLEVGGYDKYAQTNLPPVGWKAPVSADAVREYIHAYAQVEDFSRPWGFKCIKGLFFWRSLLEAFPHACAVIVHREEAEHVASLHRTPFMTAYNTEDGWRDYRRMVYLHLSDMLRNADPEPVVFMPKHIRLGNRDRLEEFACECGLNPRSIDTKFYQSNKYIA